MTLTERQQRIVEANMGLVGRVIKDKVHGLGQEGAFTYDDLFQIGCIGLCKAAATDKGGCFSTYAYRLIWNEICDALVKTTRIHLGVVILILLSAAVYYYLFYTAGGFRMRAVGLNREAAECSGISIRTNVIKAMLFSSAIAGLGGAVEILGVQFRLIDGFGSGYGFDGVAMALIGQLQPFGVLLTSMLFGILRTGANSMQRLAGIPASVIDVIQALIIFFVVSAGSIQLLHGRERKTAKAAKEES